MELLILIVVLLYKASWKQLFFPCIPFIRFYLSPLQDIYLRCSYQIYVF